AGRDEPATSCQGSITRMIADVHREPRQSGYDGMHELSAGPVLRKARSRLAGRRAAPRVRITSDFQSRRLRMFLPRTGVTCRILAAAAWLALSLLASVAHAQAGYPNKSIKFVVPYAAGGFPDTVA